MPGLKKLVTKFFKEKEILYAEDFYSYVSRKKVVVYVPSDLADKLAVEMANAGAGRIGNYEMCSFKSNGTGTFKPNKKAKPFAGKKNVLNHVEEAKLEMECSPEEINNVITALLKSHPYDEAAYEIFDFKKRNEKPAGLTIALKSNMTLTELFKRINVPKPEYEERLTYRLTRLALITGKINENIIESARFTNCKCIISSNKNTFKLIII